MVTYEKEKEWAMYQLDSRSKLNCCVVVLQQHIQHLNLPSHLLRRRKINLYAFKLIKDVPSKLSLSSEQDGSTSDKASAPALPIEFPDMIVGMQHRKGEGDIQPRFKSLRELDALNASAINEAASALRP